MSKLKHRKLNSPKTQHVTYQNKLSTKLRITLMASACLCSLLGPWANASEGKTDSSTNNKQTTALSNNQTQAQPKAAETLLLDIVANQNILLAVGQRGHILRSSDAGKNFSRIQSNISQTLTSLCFLSDKVVIAAGHHLTLLRSEDAGKTWQKIALELDDSVPWLDLIALDDNQVLAIGAYGHMARSTDQGKTWQVEFPMEEDYHLNAIIRTGEKQLFIAGEAGRAYRSNDLGRNWQVLSPPYAGSFFAAYKIAPQKVLLLGLRGNALVGDLSTETPQWSSLSLGTTQSWFGISKELNSNTLWLAGAAGQLIQLDMAYLAELAQATAPHTASEHEISEIQSAHRKDRADIAKLLAHNNSLWAVGQSGLKQYEIKDSPKGTATEQILLDKEYVFHP